MATYRCVWDGWSVNAAFVVDVEVVVDTEFAVCVCVCICARVHVGDGAALL